MCARRSEKHRLLCSKLLDQLNPAHRLRLCCSPTPGGETRGKELLQLPGASDFLPGAASRQLNLLMFLPQNGGPLFCAYLHVFCQFVKLCTSQCIASWQQAATFPHTTNRGLASAAKGKRRPRHGLAEA